MSELEKSMSDEGLQKLLKALGLCVRANKVIFGVPMVCEALRKGGANSPVLILEPSDASCATQKKIADKAAYYKVRKVRIDCDGATLALALGKTYSLAAIAITDKQMCKMVEKYI